MAIVFLALGSNLGNRRQYLQHAIDLLEKNEIHVRQQAEIIETDPEGGPQQGPFLNTVVEVETDLPPEDLLEQILKIENQLERKRSAKNAPRTIDIDILLYNQIAFRSPQLIIPHPRMLERNFVMTPLKEIAPDRVNTISHANH